MPKTQWSKAAARFREIRTAGGFFNFIQQHADVARELSESVPTCVCCMDGRVASHENAIAIAGSGILIKDNPKERAHFIAELKKRGITKLSSHDECGALKLYAQQKEISMEEAEEHMAAWLKELATELGSTEASERFPVPFHFHNEACAYVILTDRFSFAQAHGLPVGFEISAFVVSKEMVFAQVQVALDIAFGEHGFGDWFTAETPFSVVVVAPDEAQMQAWESCEELKTLVAPYGDRVVIDGFVLSETEAPSYVVQGEPALVQASV